METSGQTATFLWDTNLDYDDYLVVYTKIIETEPFNDATEQGAAANAFPKSTSTFTETSFSRGAAYVTTIEQYAGSIAGLTTTKFFSIGE